MQLVQLIVPAEAAHETVEELGQIGLVQFKDLNEEQSAFQRNYAVQVKRCDELARKLRFFREQVQKQRPEWMPRNRNEGTVETSGMLLRTGNGGGSSQHSQRWDMDELETKLEEMEQRMIEANTNNDQLRKSHAELVEMQMVMERASHFFDEARILAADTEDTIPLQSRANNPLERTDSGRPLLEGDSLQTAAMARGLGYVTGLILQEKMLSFERVLFRATRGNMFMKQVRFSLQMGTVIPRQGIHPPAKQHIRMKPNALQERKRPRVHAQRRRMLPSSSVRPPTRDRHRSAETMSVSPVGLDGSRKRGGEVKKER